MVLFLNTVKTPHNDGCGPTVPNYVPGVCEVNRQRFRVGLKFIFNVPFFQLNQRGPLWLDDLHHFPQ
jgi:hypothetical protein